MSRRVTTRRQGVDEQIRYALDVTNWGNTPTNVAVVVYDITEPTAIIDVTTDVSTGDATIADNIITLPMLYQLVANHTYRIDVAFTTEDQARLEPYLVIWAEE